MPKLGQFVRPLTGKWKTGIFRKETTPSVYRPQNSDNLYAPSGS